MTCWSNWVWSFFKDEFFCSEENHPVSKLKQNINKAKRENPEMNEFTVFLSTGSFCPIHTEHVRLLEIAKQYFEDKLGKTVIGGYFSPSHDDYVGRKLKEKNHAHINGYHRWKIISKVVENSSWLEADPFEVSQVRLL